MPLLPLPDILLGPDFRNKETGKWEFPENATDEQKAAFEDFKKRIKKASENRIKITPPTPDDIKECLAAEMKNLSKAEHIIKLERYRSTIEPILGKEIDEIYALYL